tara:strand:- start:3638 stop:3859 length:222 start_codon:yes stop_codon:yes gene_type:complete
VELEFLSVLATPAGTAAVAIYFVHKFMAFHKETVDKCLEDAAEDRKLFLQAITKIDTRLSYLEKLVEKIMEKQ